MASDERHPERPNAARGIDGEPAKDTSELRRRVADLAHDLSNPLAAIMGFTQLLLKRQWHDDDRAALASINSEAIRATAVVRDLLALVRDPIVSRDEPRRALDVLVVADESVDLSAIEELLSSRGHAMIAARRSDAALRLANTTPFDVVVCDERFVASDGRELAAALRAATNEMGARFIGDIPLAPPAGGTGRSSTARRVDADALRRLVEGD